MDAEDLRGLFAEFGPVDVRRMFGGQGVFAHGLMIALVARGEIYLKADTETMPSFEAEGQRPFSYGTKDGERVLTSYWRMPERLYDDTGELARWALASLAVAQRANEKPKRAEKPKTVAKKRAVRRPAASRRRSRPGRSRT